MIAAIAAAPIPSIFLIAMRVIYGPIPPIAPLRAFLLCWCALGGLLYVLFLARLRGEERRANRAPALMYSIGLWFASTFVAILLAIVTAIAVFR